MASLAEDINVDELRRRARRRLVGAIVLALAAAVIVPMLLESEPRPLGEDVAVKIPPVDEGKFVNRLNDPAAKVDKAADAAKSEAAKPKYDTRIADKAPPADTKAPAAAPKAAETTPAVEPKAVPAEQKPSPPAEAKAAAPEPKAATPATASAKPPGSVAATPVPSTASPPAPTATATPPAASTAAAAASSAAASGTFAVQLAAFSDDKGANALAGRLKRAGYSAYTEPLKTSKGTLWRVRVGPYPTREAANAARDKLKSEGQSGIVASSH